MTALPPEVERLKEVAKRSRERSDDLLKRINRKLKEGLKELGHRVDRAEGLEDEIEPEDDEEETDR